MEPLTPERWHRARILFDQAVELPVHERSAFLQSACADASLRAEVEALLRADATGNDLVDGPVHQAAPGLFAEMGARREAEEAAASIGKEAGPYRIVKEIARGGMSVVYLAERADGQFEHRVALKLIKRGMDSDAIVQRFLRERQILARLQHPGIARLYDGGLTDDGQPFFAMEYVTGEPVTVYADRHRLGIEARLRLFVQVCEAVAFAHRSLVVHRDLKPSNVLVMDVEGVPHVKLLDFGIAKFLDDPDADVLTQTGVRVLTPAYAAPEQVAGEPVTTLTDVYALGGLLYELLTGRRASAVSDPASVTVPRPSTVVRVPVEAGESSSAEPIVSPEAVSAARGLPVERLRRRLSGDLDTICLKALRKEPERRYASAEELADDVRRHLDRLPVRARPDTLVYRVRTFIARHRIGVAAGALVVLSLISGLGVALWQADVARRESAQKAIEAARATATLDYILDLFGELNPAEAQGRRFTARDLITPGLRRLDVLQEQPLDYAAVAQRLGQLGGAMGQFAVAESLLARSQAIQEMELPPDAPELATTMERRAHVLQAQTRYAEADSLLERALAIRRFRAATNTDALIQTLNQYAHVALNLGDLRRAESAYTEALALQARRAGTAATDRPRSRRGLAEVYVRAGDFDRGIALLEEALAEYVQLEGPTHTETARARFSLAQTYQQLGRFDRADSLLRAALQVYRRVYGADNHQVGAILANLGNVWRDAGDAERAMHYYEEAVTTYDRVVPGPYLLKALALEKLGTLRMTSGRPGRAESVLRRAYAMAQELGDEDPIRVPRMRLVLAGCLHRLGEHQEAYDLLRENYTRGAVTAPEGEARKLQTQTLRGLARIAEHLGRSDEAARYGRELEALTAGGEVD